jgi:predicted solute-binding protein
MKKIITAFVFTAILVSCNSGDKTKNKDLESSENETELINSVSKEIKERLKINPNDAEAYYNRGKCKKEFKRRLRSY